MHIISVVSRYYLKWKQSKKVLSLWMYYLQLTWRYPVKLPITFLLLALSNKTGVSIF